MVSRFIVSHGSVLFRIYLFGEGNVLLYGEYSYLYVKKFPVGIGEGGVQRAQESL